MVSREPRLLCADLRVVGGRLMRMRLQAPAADVLAIVAAQPVLLVEETGGGLTQVTVCTAWSRSARNSFWGGDKGGALGGCPKGGE